MSLTSLSIIMAVVVTNIYEKSRQNGTKDNRLPRIIRIIFLKKLACYLGMSSKTRELYELLVNLKNKEKEEARLRNKNMYVEERSSFPRMNTNNSSNSFAPNVDASSNSANLIQMIAFDLRKRRRERPLRLRFSNDRGSYELDPPGNAYNQRCPNCENCCCDETRSSCPLDADRSNSHNNLAKHPRENSVSSVDRNAMARVSRGSINSYEPTSPVWMKKTKSPNPNSKQHVPTSKRNSGGKRIRQEQQYRLSRQGSGGSFEAETREVTSEEEQEEVRSVTAPGRREKFKASQRTFKIKPANLSLYIGYEYVLFSLVLDRCFFWFYAAFTVLGYVFTLYVVPFWLRTEKKDYTYLAP